MNKQKINKPVEPMHHKAWLELRKDEIDNYIYQCIQFGSPAKDEFITERNILISHIEAHNKRESENDEFEKWRETNAKIKRLFSEIQEPHQDAKYYDNPVLLQKGKCHTIEDAEKLKYEIEESIINGEQRDVKVEPFSDNGTEFYNFIKRVLGINEKTFKNYISALEGNGELILLKPKDSVYFFAPADSRDIYGDNPELYNMADNGFFVNMKGDQILRIRDKKDFKKFLKSIYN